MRIRYGWMSGIIIVHMRRRKCLTRKTKKKQPAKQKLGMAIQKEKEDIVATVALDMIKHIPHQSYT